MRPNYILLKDLPDAGAGEVVVWDESANAYFYQKGSWVSPHRYNYLTAGTVCQSPEWFKEAVEKSPMELAWERVRDYKSWADPVTVREYYSQKMFESGWSEAEKHFKSQQ